MQDECYVVHAADWRPISPRSTWLQGFDLELSVVALVGARVGFGPGELLDSSRASSVSISSATTSESRSRGTAKSSQLERSRV